MTTFYRRGRNACACEVGPFRPVLSIESDRLTLPASPSRGAAASVPIVTISSSSESVSAIIGAI